MINKKEMYRKAKALLLAGTMSATLSGCRINVDEDLLEKLGIEVTIETDEDGKVKGGNISSKEETNVTVETTQHSDFVTSTTTTVTSGPVIVTQSPVSVETKKNVVTDVSVTNESQTTGTTTEMTKQICDQKIDFGNICMDSWLSFGDFRVVDEVRDFKLDEENSTLWSLAVKYHPSNESTMQFLERIKKINEIDEEEYPYILKVPVRSIYYVGRGNLGNVPYYTDVNVQDICKMNKIEYKNGIEYDYPDEPYNLLVKTLPEGTLSFNRNDGFTTYIKGNALIPSKKIIDIDRTYGDDFSYAFIELCKENDYQGPCFFTRVCENGEYTRYLVGYNVDKVYLLDGVPVMEARDEMTCYMYGLANGKDSSMYTTAATIMDPNAYYFYRNLDGKVCFTFDSTDLTKYGYVRADELRDTYVKYPEAYMQSLEQFGTEHKTK